MPTNADTLPDWFYANSPLTMDPVKGPDEQYRAGARDMLSVLANRVPGRAVPEATIDNGAYEDDTQRHVPTIFLAGPIKHWWGCFDSPEAQAYFGHREMFRTILVHANYLTYASWTGFKGPWDPRAQAVNNAAILASDLMIILGAPDIPADGTDDERRFAQKHGIPILYAPPGSNATVMLRNVHRIIGEGVPYEA